MRPRAEFNRLEKYLAKLLDFTMRFDDKYVVDGMTHERKELQETPILGFVILFTLFTNGEIHMEYVDRKNVASGLTEWDAKKLFAKLTRKFADRSTWYEIKKIGCSWSINICRELP